jgi:membrane protease YdiL (CAAX protease family)
MGFIARFPLFPRVLLFALLPALCEESLFRGALLASVRRWGALPSCLTSALLFALFHGSPLRFVPVAVLGLSLSAVVWITGNVWLAVAGHALHNLLILAALETYGVQGEPSPKALAAWALLGLLLVYAGILVARTSRVREQSR